MNTIFGRMNPIFEWTVKISGANILWVLFNLPIFYLTLLLFTTENAPQITMLAITIAILVPFIFFPATTALFGVVRKWVLKEEASTVRYYLKYYKENFRRSVAGGLILTLLWSLLVVDFYYVQVDHTIVRYVFLFLLIWLFLVTLYFFAHTVHTETKLLQSIKTSFILSIVNPFFSLGSVIIYIGILYTSIKHLTFLLPFFSGTLIAFLSFSGYLKLFGKVIELQKKNS